MASNRRWRGQFRFRGSRRRYGVAQLFSLGCYTFMKTTLTILLSGLLLCGCSQKQATSARPAIDLVEVGKDITWRGGIVLHVTKRDGASLEGIQIIGTAADGQKMTTTADTGTLTPGSVENAADDSAVRITLHNAKSVSAKSQATMPELMLVLHK
jgi:hypothetical protein